MSRNAYIVVGPESSGNRYLVRFLCAAGCAGRGEQDQPFDGPAPGYRFVPPTDVTGPIAFYRSFPHGGLWPDLSAMATTARRAGFLVTVLVMVRDPAVVEMSQVRDGHVITAESALVRVQEAYRAIFDGLSRSGSEFVVVPYQSLARPSFRRWLTDRLGLPSVPDGDAGFVDGDTKYISGEVRRVLDQADKTATAAEVRQYLDAWGGRAVVSNGVFRLLHAGHCHTLRWAREQGDVLVVAVNDDASAARIRPGQFVLPLAERARLLSELSCVDFVVPFAEDTPAEVLRIVRPEVLVKGPDYAGQEVAGAEYAAEVRFAPLSPFSRHATDMLARG